MLVLEPSTLYSLPGQEFTPTQDLCSSPQGQFNEDSPAGSKLPCGWLKKIAQFFQMIATENLGKKLQEKKS